MVQRIHFRSLINVREFIRIKQRQAEFRHGLLERTPCAGLLSDFDIRNSFGFRPSGFGFLPIEYAFSFAQEFEGLRGLSFGNRPAQREPPGA